jgi:antirestriction protein ArdC
MAAKVTKQEIEEKVTDAIIESLEAGVAPWAQPWAGAAMPTSLSTARPYRGINYLILSTRQIKEGYKSPLWGTYKQIAALGGQVRKGETGTPIVFWKKITIEDRETGKDKSIPLLRYYTVFNIEQADGVEITPRHAAAIEGRERPDVDVESIESVREYATRVWDETGNSKPSIVSLRQDRAYYSPEMDMIVLPEADQFRSVAGFTGTMFHEFVHSTGHESRLDRWTGKERGFGCADYAEEELVAEIGAAMMAARLGLDVEIEQSAAYVASWLKRLKDDRGLLIAAAQRAQKATDWIAGDYVDETVAEEVAVA